MAAKTYALNLTVEQLETIHRGLQELPFKSSAMVIATLQHQVALQDARERLAHETAAKPAANAAPSGEQSSPGSPPPNGVTLPVNRNRKRRRGDAAAARANQ